MATTYDTTPTGSIGIYSGDASYLTISNEYTFNSSATFSNSYLNVTATAGCLSGLSTSTAYGPLQADRFTTSVTDIPVGLFDMGTTPTIGPYYGMYGGDYISTGNCEVVLDPEQWKGTPAYEVMKKQAQMFKIRSQLSIVVKSRACPISGASKEEQRALDTLREMISESDFRKYLKHGFLMVRGASGDLYQVYRGRSHTKIWRSGEVVEEVCVRIKDPSVPPTDNVIAFKMAIEVSEEAFKAMGNLYKMKNNVYRIAA